MPYTVEQLPGEAIIRVAYTNPLDIQHDVEKVVSQILELAADIPGDMYVIHDAHEFKIGFSELVMAMAAGLRPRKSELAWDPRIRGLVVGAGGLVKLGVESAKQTQYGGLSFELFGTLDEAVDYAREKLAQGE